MTTTIEQRQRVAKYRQVAEQEAKLPPHTIQTILNLTLCAWFMQECIDALRGTTYDGRALKMRMNQLEPELKKVIDNDMDAIWGIDDLVMYRLQDGVREFFSDFSTMRPEQLAAFSALFRRFKELPEQTLAALDVKIVESQNVQQTQDISEICELLTQVKDTGAIKNNLRMIIQNQLNKEDAWQSKK